MVSNHSEQEKCSNLRLRSQYHQPSSTCGKAYSQDRENIESDDPCHSLMLWRCGGFPYVTAPAYGKAQPLRMYGFGRKTLNGQNIRIPAISYLAVHEVTYRSRCMGQEDCVFNYI